MAFNDFGDGVNFTALSATPATFQIGGGTYAFGVNATWGGGNVVLQICMPDKATYLTLGTFTADGTNIYQLPTGTYRITITTATAVQGFLISVPYQQS